MLPTIENTTLDISSQQDEEKFTHLYLHESHKPRCMLAKRAISIMLVGGFFIACSDQPQIQRNKAKGPTTADIIVDPEESSADVWLRDLIR